ncbi:hydroxymethylpyrimidine pyrophosphatase-like HAD family hydrolase [Bacillus oleivorans]|uniref:Hydroxymethylpyrimidine pyrophosphatase-like HAD family hydrolase n=1 Tax=Bacillus oleivorans TaxID=1448271 RepID=A0A285CMH9_9BACI|nr:HAD family hydrolase [Bacillus oleivorans]SNX68268.1 hydroxymethylpyrimidine pyrophosphatase-like HAD family hydrolase [Bacillus oleivorans]
MIFATDLDRTLIFSKRALSEFHQSEEDLIEVERTKLHRSYMSKLSYQLIKELNTKITIIPITTRTFDQYNRLAVPFFNKRESHYVTSNGAVVIKNGKRDTEWDQILLEKMSQFPYPFSSVNQLLLTYENQNVIDVQRLEHLYFCLTFKKANDIDLIVTILAEIEAMGWEHYTHRNKIYVIPPFLQKGNAIKYIKQKTRETISWAAGDSRMDYSFLSLSERSFVPRHGELALHMDESSRWIKTKTSGLKAAEEILLTIYKEVFLGSSLAEAINLQVRNKEVLNANINTKVKTKVSIVGKKGDNSRQKKSE